MTRHSAFARTTRVLRRRAALGLNPVTAPVLLFVPLGFLLGPFGFNVLSATALDHLDLVITLALSTLGVIIGMAAAREARTARQLFAASAAEAAITMAIVAGALIVLVRAWNLPIALPELLLVGALGVCASASAAPSVDVADEHARQIAARVADLDDVVPIVLGVVVLSFAAPAGGVWWNAGVTVALGLAAALCGWLLLEGAHDVAERGVFVLGTLALLGGAPAYLHLSPLLAGMTAGWFWVVAPGGCDTLVTAELRKVQHPLIVLVLITAGAWLQPTLAGIWLFAGFVVFRLAGKLIGGWAASRIAGIAAPSDLGAYLIPPGVIGVAFALNVQQVASASASALVFAVTAGAVAAELIALIVTPSSSPEAAR